VSISAFQDTVSSRKTKVKNLSLATFRDENVGGFDVAMDDALGVCDAEPICNLDANVQKSFDLHRSASDTVLERHSIKKLHHDECLPVRVPDVVNRTNIRMIYG
jgi:hypothetical protein